MAPIIEVSDETLASLNRLGLDYTLKSQKNVSPNETSTIYVPSIGYDVARERTGYGKNWYDSHNLQGNEVMLSPARWTEFLKHARDNDPELFNSITEIRNSWRAEWIDAYFEQRNDDLYILTENGTKAEKLDEDTLMEDGGISLDSWLDNPTPQGLPRTDTTKGDLYYGHSKDGTVSRFSVDSLGAGFFCGGASSGRSSKLGVRAATKRE